MRTTINLDDDVFAFVRVKAQRERASIGEVVSDLVREGIRSHQTTAYVLQEPKSKYAVLPARDELITNEHVQDLRDKEGI
jgi:negative regulator of replication initiation